MRTIGQILKYARINKKYSYEDLEKKTKIKSSFINLIENENWESLPPFPIVFGFVKSLSDTLEMNEKSVVAVLKRDYPPKKIRMAPKPDVTNKLWLNPKRLFFLGVALLIMLFFGYLLIQYIHFIKPPTINLESPTENQTVETKSLIVFGSTNSDVKLVINNQPVLVDDDGKFSISIDVSENTKEITVVATSRSGKETVIHRKIEVK